MILDKRPTLGANTRRSRSTEYGEMWGLKTPRCLATPRRWRSATATLLPFEGGAEMHQRGWASEQAAAVEEARTPPQNQLFEQCPGAANSWPSHAGYHAFFRWVACGRRLRCIEVADHNMVSMANNHMSMTNSGVSMTNTLSSMRKGLPGGGRPGRKPRRKRVWR